MKKYSLFFAILLYTQTLLAQVLSGASTVWGNSFVEWELYAIFPDSSEVADEEEEPEEYDFGNLKLRWLSTKDDWTEWDYSLNDGAEQGTIKLKWKNDPTQWELRTYDGSVVTMKASWVNDLSEWRITDNATSITFKSKWSNQYDEWLAKDANLGSLYIYTLRSKNPRDWAIEDKLNKEISNPMKMAMLFIALYHGSPRM
jgi:hypothetical protein